MKKASDVFNSIRYAKNIPKGKKHPSTDNEEHYTVGEKEYEQQIKHVKKMAMQEAESTDKGEYDYEGDMAMSDLRSIMHNAQRLHDMLKPDTNLPEWCQSKITLAEDYISTVANYMQGEMSEEVKEPTGSLKDACWKGYTAVGMKMKNGRKAPNCVPMKEEVEQLDEMPGANMDTRAVHSHLKKKGWKLSRSSGSHDVYTHSEAEHHIAVPRHKQLKAPLVKGILKQAEIKESEIIVTPRKNIKAPAAPGTYAHDLASGKYAKYGFTKSGKETAAAKRERMKKEEVEQLDEINAQTKSSYIEKAKAQVKELQPHAKKGEYKDLAKNIIARRKKGIQMAKEESEELVDTPAKKSLSKSAGMVKDLYKKAKSKKETPEKFQAEPELSSQITKV